jgi:predicted aldo/keto reductase-like oxidoreductase
MIKSEAFHAAVKQLKNEGRLRFCGVSCHGSMWIHEPKESMEEILLAAVDDGRFDVLLMTYNYLMQDMGKKIMTACKEKNIGTTIMKTDPYSKYFVLKEMYNKLSLLQNSSAIW